MHMQFSKPVPTFQQAVLLHDNGRFRDAEKLYQKLLSEDDRHFGALCRLGVLRLQQRQFLDAEHFFRRAVKVDKRSADAHQFLGFALTGLGRLDDAVRSYEKTIALRPGFAEAHNNLGYALQVLGRFDKAMAHYQKAIAIRRDYHEAHNNLGNALHLLNRSEEAIACYTRALEIKPDYAEALWNLGTALRVIGRLEDAIPCYQKAIAIRPDYHQAYNSLGNTLWKLGRPEEALAHYEKAITVSPNYVDAHVNRGDVLAALGREDTAIAAYEAALGLRPNDSQTLSKRGDALVALDRQSEALACFEAALATDPHNNLAFDGLARCAKMICDWGRRETVSQRLTACAAAGQFIHPFNVLRYSSDAALQLASAKRFVAQEIPIQPPQLWRGGIWHNPRIKIAYVATGFHNHATAFLTAELFEIHDRSRFEILGVSLGRDDQSEVRARLIRAFDQFYDALGKSDREVAEQLNALRVDIAVDCSGFIVNARPGIFAFRPAPIQVNYLAYPGTLGASFYDYIIADPTVLPFDQQPFYSEKIVQLPDCYQVNDSRRPVAARTPTREEAGLPKEGFVFCCFNQSDKITPAMFAIWMRLLAEVEGSVVWLFGDRPMTENNLRREAAARGVDASRLIFAGYLPLDRHLARLRLADLFLDTLPYNAHTTASDALWMGLPVVTCCGQSFAGRVATSLLRSIGMPDLVTHNLEAYERLALRIAREPSLLKELRDRLQRNRLSHPLFNTDRYRRHIEAAYLRMWERWQWKETPISFAVETAPE